VQFVVYRRAIPSTPPHAAALTAAAAAAAAAVGSVTALNLARDSWRCV